MRKIVFNGEEYDSLEAMPPNTRRAFEASMAGLTDEQRRELQGILRGAADATSPAGPVQSRHSIVVDGKEYSDPSRMPPAVRAAYQQMRLRAGIREENNVAHVISGAGPPPGGDGLHPSGGRFFPDAEHRVVMNVTSDDPSSGRTGWYVALVVLAILALFLVFGRT